MKNNLTVRNVNFLGDTLMAAQDAKGNIWAGVSYICNGIGFSKNEKDLQVKKVKSDLVLQEGCVKFDAGVFDPNNETIALKIDFVPLWLAKITITPSMKEEQPELVKKLVDYQLKAKDVLAAAFIPEKFTKSTEETKPKKQKTLASVNAAAKIILSQLEAAGLDPVQRTYFLKDIYAPVGIAVPMIRVEQEMIYDQTQIAKLVGIYSKAGKPHAQAIGAIIWQLDIDKNDIVETSFSKNGHPGVSEQYKEPVLEQVKEWLEDNGYPVIINGIGKEFRVFYRELETA